jgi:hypothetical protein
VKAPVDELHLAVQCRVLAACADDSTIDVEEHAALVAEVAYNARTVGLALASDLLTAAARRRRDAQAVAT